MEIGQKQNRSQKEGEKYTMVKMVVSLFDDDFARRGTLLIA